MSEQGSKLRLTREKLFNLALALAMSVLMVCGWFSLHSAQEIFRSTDERAAAAKQLIKLERIYSSLQDAEASETSFSITGSTRALENFRAAKAKAESQIELLRASGNKEPHVQRWLVNLETLVLFRLESLNTSVELKPKGVENKNWFVNERENEILRGDAIRSEFNRMKSEAESLVQTRTTSAKTILDNSIQVVALGSLVSLFLFFIASLVLKKNQQHRAKAERELKALNFDLQDKARPLKGVIDAQQAVASAGLERSKLLEIIVQQVQILTNSDSAIYEEIEGDELVYRTVWGAATPHLGFKIKREGSFAGLCVQQGAPLICDDIELDPRVNRDACRKINLRSMIVAPLVHNSVVIGVLKASSCRPNHFTEEQKNTLKLITRLLSVALNQATAFEEQQKSVTSLRTAKQELTLARDEAESATRAKSEFLANMSHEIRTPINGVLGMASLLLDTSLTLEQRSHADAVRSSAGNLLTIINDILDFSKVEAGKIDLENVNFDLPQLVANIERTLAFSAQQRGVKIKIDFAETLPKSFWGDPTRLGQVLLNLVSNAIKFTKDGHVAIVAKLEPKDNSENTSNQKSEQALRFEVTDTGIGIPPQDLEKLFTAFSQADSSTTRRFGGTGLGLSISKHLVTLMNGEIGVQSEVGKGSTFWIVISLKEAPSIPSSVGVKSVRALEPAKKLRILVVEDNSVNQIIAIKMLEKMGHSAVVAGNGCEALDLLREAPYDLILMDCQMPEMDGYEATRIIRTSKSLGRQNVPIIAMTANAMAGDREKCLQAGMDDYASKPIRIEDLFHVIEHTVKQKQEAA